MITGKHVSLRALEPHDRDLMYSWENNMENWPVSGTLSPFSRQTMDEFLRNAKDDIYTTRQLRLAIDVNNPVPQRTIGYVDLFDFDPPHRRAGVGILVGDTKERGKGYAFETLQLLSTYAKNVLNLHQLYCHIHADNLPSIRLFTKAGYAQCGELKDWTQVAGQWRHVGVYQNLLQAG
jgi:diamine N-acetyltransferase